MKRGMQEELAMLLHRQDAPKRAKKPRKKPEYKTAESKVVAACLGYLKLRGCFVWRNNTGALQDKTWRWVRFGLKGSADIVGLTLAGRFISVECKANGNHLEPDQKSFMERVIALGGIYIMARSIDELISEMPE